MSAAVAASPPSAGVAPSATTTIENVLPVVSWRCVMWLQTSSMSNGLLGHEDDVGAAGQAGGAGDPARVAAHDLADDHAVVRLGGRVQAVDRLGRDLHRGLKAEREVRRVEVVVDRLGHADGRKAGLEELARHAERVVAADRDQHVDAALLQRREHPLLAVLGLVDVRARGAEDRAALVQDAARVLARQLDGVVVEHALPALAKAVQLVAVGVDPLANDSADDGVESGAVSAAREKSDSCHGAIVCPGVAGRLAGRTGARGGRLRGLVQCAQLGRGLLGRDCRCGRCRCRAPARRAATGAGRRRCASRSARRRAGRCAPTGSAAGSIRSARAAASVRGVAARRRSRRRPRSARVAGAARA